MMAFRDVYYLFVDIWRLYRKYAGNENVQNECEMIIKDAAELNKKYSSIFAKEMIVAVVNELSLIVKMKEQVG